ncbi:MAG: periplasmic heavy metal sensor [Desulfobacteraceae bacterium]|nr:periplasmic heavy metal sensor [Desulfobacteraceae bacterium]
MKKTVILISSFLAVVLISGSVMAWGGGHRGSQRGMGYGYNEDCQGQGKGRGAWQDLSESQREQLKTLKQQFIDNTYEIRQAMFQNRQEMRMLMETSDPDKAKLSGISNQIADLEKQIRDKRIDFMLEAKKIAPELHMMTGRGFGGKRAFKNKGFGGGGCSASSN